MNQVHGQNANTDTAIYPKHKLNISTRLQKVWMTFSPSPPPSIIVLLKVSLHFLELLKENCLTHTLQFSYLCGSSKDL